jgi:hypothetical protein
MRQPGTPGTRLLFEVLDMASDFAALAPKGGNDMGVWYA